MVNPKKSKFEEITTQINNDLQTNINQNLNNGNPIVLHYPNDLGEKGQEAFMIFKIMEPVRLFGGEPKEKKSIALYLPATLRVAYGADYEDFTDYIKQIVNLGQDVLTAGAAVPGGIAGLSEQAYRGTLNLDTLASSLGSAGKALGTEAWHAVGNVAGVLSSDIRRKFQQMDSSLLNPHMAVAFTGVPFRKFEFSFQMMARTEHESFTIREIIREFKKAMHPTIDSSATRRWIYPDNFKIKMFTPVEGNKFLFEIDTCALTSVNVDYAGSGVPSFFSRTGAPVDVRMTLTFQELKVLTSEDFDGDKNY
jgi:hypothetical protein